MYFLFYWHNIPYWAIDEALLEGPIYDCILDDDWVPSFIDESRHVGVLVNGVPNFVK